jgi:hypothetical protein
MCAALFRISRTHNVAVAFLLSLVVAAGTLYLALVHLWALAAVVVYGMAHRVRNPWATTEQTS